MPQSSNRPSKFGVSDALVIAALRHARYNFKSSSVEDLENDETALALWNDKKTIKRDIYRFWPRDPNGDNILPGNSFLGKMTSNEIQFWGATLWDFFWTNRLPNVPNVRTGSTSSKLSKWMIEHKETQHAAPELGWAKVEADPHQISPYSIADVIEAQEMRIRLGLCGKSMPSDAGKVKDKKTSDEKGQGGDSGASDQGMAVDEGDNEDESSDGKEDQGSDKEASDQASSEMAVDKPDDEVDNKDDRNEDQDSNKEMAVDDSDGKSDNKGERSDDSEASEERSRESKKEDQEPVMSCPVIIPFRESDKEDREPVMFEDYPAPWPLIPFSYEAPKIEQRLPLHMLPKHLIVHDPWDLLSINCGYFNRYREAKKTHDWTVTEDKTYVYTLSLGLGGKKRVEEELAALKDTKKKEHVLERSKQKGAPRDQFPDGHDGMLLCPSTATPGPAEPPILAVFPVAPDLKPVEEAHLYITPEKIAGEGNHSLVLHAEWEVPRSLLVPDMLCNECLLEDVQKTIIECDGEDGSRKLPRFKEKSGRWKAVEYCKPEVALDMVFDSPCSAVNGSYLHDLGSRRTVFEYDGPVRQIMTNVKWQSADKGPYCSHFLKRIHMNQKDKLNDDHVLRPHPPTAKVSLIAKLSTGDDHLGIEARNYEKFPQHFFEHWNGYNVVDPMHKPVPVNAVVPQYYGYYFPEKDKDLSPILLMEDCGRQINVEDLCMDDRNECATLFYKFHHAGYLHESAYPRNVLCQRGPLNRPRYQRGTGQYTEDGRKYMFRLIDFGRSRKFKTGIERSVEESSVAKLFKIFHHAEF